MQLIACQRDEMLCATYVSEVAIHSVDMFMFLDEAGFDRRDIIRHYTYSWRGLPTKGNKFLIRDEHLSSVVFMSTQGVLDCKVVNQAVNGNLFYGIIQCTLLPI